MLKKHNFALELWLYQKTTLHQTEPSVSNDRELIGKRLKPFSYIGKVILSMADWKKKEESEIQRIKTLQRNPTWVISKLIGKVLYLKIVSK